MADKENLVKGKRRFLIAATGVAGGVAAGAPVEADISGLAPGELLTVEWRGKPVWIVHRTPEMLDIIKKNDDKVADPESKKPMQPAYAKNELRSIKPDYLVVVGICTHLGCSPVEKFKATAEAFDANWQGGFFCPCHGSLFDLAGRVYKNKPAPDNLQVPPYKFLSDSRILIGDDSKGA